MRTYIYILRILPPFQDENRWGEPENHILQKHADRLERLAKRGTVKYVGRTDLPVSDEQNFGLVIFDSENDTTAELFAQSDPAVMGGLMSVQCFQFNHVF